MRIGRTLPPAAAPLSFKDLLSGLKGMAAGPSEEERVRRELRAYFNRKHCFFVSSGKAALTLILLALKEIHPDRHEVLMPAFACYSVPSAIINAGLHIQLCDIDIETLDYNFDELGIKLKNPNLLCVLSLHLFGLPADVERLKKLRPDPTVTVVEDAAQAMGGEWQGKKLGTLGDVAFFSLGRGKALTAVEGGVIITDDEELRNQLQSRVALLPGCGPRRLVSQIVYALALVLLLHPQLFWIPCAMPFLHLGQTRYDPHFSMYRFSSFQAGLLRGSVKKLSQFRHIRQKNTRFWADHCSNLMVRRLSKQRLSLPDLLRFPLHLPSGKAVENLTGQSDRLGLGLARTYPDAIHGIPELRKLFVGQDFPKARRASQEILTLPLHGFLNEKDREQIIYLLAAEEAVWERVG